MNAEEIQKFKEIFLTNNCVFWSPNCYIAKSVVSIKTDLGPPLPYAVLADNTVVNLTCHELSEFVIGKRL